MTEPVGHSVRRARWVYLVFGLCLVDAALGFAQGVIDGRPFYWLLHPAYAPHRYAARVIGVPRGLITLVVFVIVGVALLRWGFRRMAR